MPLHVAASVQRVGIGPRRPVRHQSIFCERANIRGTTLPAGSPGLLEVLRLSGFSNFCCWKKNGKYFLATALWGRGETPTPRWEKKKKKKTMEPNTRR